MSGGAPVGRAGHPGTEGGEQHGPTDWFLNFAHTVICRGTIAVVVECQVMPIVTSRLLLVPVTPDLARAVIRRRISDIRVGPGWPHADTADAMAMALRANAGPSWVITLDGVVIGDCGEVSWPDEDGVVEIGYGLAQPFRGNGYATEAAEGMCRWLFSEARATAVSATGVDRDNVASRRVLEKLGFAQLDENDRHISYRLQRHGDGPR